MRCCYWASRAPRQEKEGLRCAYVQDNPLRCHRIGDVVLSDFILNFQDRIPTLPVMAEEYRQRYPVGWLDNTIPLHPIVEILPAP
ncbi:hypothetical protein LIER_28081 [Lithospermum erythrorhizon]|uniref:Uncharacterized protein n=1 Tax=Lithospermum erythrorhizon TaxID=34254 RepID=A0AAV3RFY3_LITER